MIRKHATTAAALLAAALAAATFVSGPTVAAAVEMTDAKAKKGTLGWGVKESFRNYIEGPIADGGIEVTPPAVRKADGTFTWKKGEGKVDLDEDTATLRLKGTVYFYGHDEGSGPTLEVYVDKPRLVIDGAHSLLMADVSSRLGGDLIEYPDVEFVTIDASGLDLEAIGDKVKVTGLTTTLTEDGAEAFAGFYAPGTAFDPISFVLRVVV